MNVRQVGAQSSQDTKLPSGLSLGTGVRNVATEKLFTQGNLVNTDNSLDVAIQGRGFVQILMPDGSLGYTRDGSFKQDDQGQLVTSNGYVVQPSISIPENALSVTVGSDGVVSATVPGDSAPSQVGTLQLADFVNPAGLQPIGQNLFKETAASGAPQSSSEGGLATW